jgi:hypothetical protein
MTTMYGKIGLFSMVAACLVLFAGGGQAQMNDGRSTPGNTALLAYRTGGSPWSPRPGQQSRYKYQYYPDTEVYYEPGREVFFYQDQGRWIKAPTLPRELRGQLGEFVIVEMYSDDPTVFHADVLRRFPGKEPAAGRAPAEPREAPPARRAPESPEPAPAPRTELRYRYHYFPAAQVYYDPSREVYFYFDHDWVKAASLPRRIEERLGDYVLVEMPTDTPDAFHAQVRKAILEAPPPLAAEPPMGPPPWRPRGTDPVYRYEYYPDSFVYYDLDRRSYFYRPDDQWVEATQLPEYIAENIGNPVALEMNTSQPYTYHREVALRYPHPGAEVNFSRPIYRVWKETIIEE